MPKKRNNDQEIKIVSLTPASGRGAGAAGASGRSGKHAEAKSGSPSSQGPVIAFKSEMEEKTQEADIKRFKAADSLINQVLQEIHDIGELLGHQKISKVENLKGRIEKRYQKIYEYLNRPEGEMKEELAAGRSQKQGPPIQEHPKLPSLGGMPMDIDKMDQDFLKEMGIDPKLDKAEIENQLKNKLQAKMKAALKVVNDFKKKLKMTNAPKMKATNKMIVKRYEQKLENAEKLILRPPAPELRPDRPLPKPSPFNR